MSQFSHSPVMVNEVLGWLHPRPGGRFADGTLGGGGHAEAILNASAPDGWLFGCDHDGDAVEAARARLGRFGNRVEIRRAKFHELGKWIEKEMLDAAVLDLGVSSYQIDTAERGFSFQKEGPLDMRMDRRTETTASDIVNRESEARLEQIFREFGGEHKARRLARAIVADRQRGPIQTTRQLATIVERVLPGRGGKMHPATKAFQGLRIAVNAEMTALERGLGCVWARLKPGGRLGVITFHSLEVRALRRFGRVLSRDYDVVGEIDRPEWRRYRPPRGKWLTKKPVRPKREEVERNPRSRSACLRVIEKVA